MGVGVFESKGTIATGSQRQGTWDDKLGDTTTGKCSNLQNCFSAHGLNRFLFPSPSSPIEQARCSISPFERAKRLFVVCLRTHLDAKVDSYLFDLFFSADEAGLVCWLAFKHRSEKKGSSLLSQPAQSILSPLSLFGVPAYTALQITIFLRPLLTSFHYYFFFFYLSAGRISP